LITWFNLGNYGILGSVVNMSPDIIYRLMNKIIWIKERTHKVANIRNNNNMSDQSHITVSDIFDMFSKAPVITPFLLKNGTLI